jgi:group I intron endonuclease
LGKPGALYDAIRKYGVENFKIEMLLKVKNTDTEHMAKTEQKYIKIYESQKSDVGYNMTMGGEGVLGLTAWNKGKKMPELSEKQKGINNSFFGKTHSDELKRKWSKTRRGKNHGMYGVKRPELALMNKNRKWSEESKAKISKAKGKPIICIELNRKFDSIKQMCLELGLDDRTVHRVINGKFKQHKGYTFKFP